VPPELHGGKGGVCAAYSCETSPNVGHRRYTLVQRLARGGMGEVHLAVAHGLGGAHKLVVVKQVLEGLADDSDFHAMFLNEAKLAASLDHPHIVRVYDVCEIDGRPSIVMEYVHGESLGRLLHLATSTHVGFPLADALTIVHAVARGLAHAHDARTLAGEPLHIVHRDVAPNNILVGYEGEVKLIDFGIARALSATRVTRGSFLKGKVAYMAPEQFEGGAIDRRTDIFSLGVVLYEVTTLKRAFRADNDAATLNRIIRGDLVRPSEAVPGYPHKLEDVVMTAVATDRDARFANAAAFHEALAEAARDAGLDLSLPRVGATTVTVAGSRPLPQVGSTTLAIARARRWKGSRAMVAAFGAGVIATGLGALAVFPTATASSAARGDATELEVAPAIAAPIERISVSTPKPVTEPVPAIDVPRVEPADPPRDAAPKRRRRPSKRSDLEKHDEPQRRTVPRGLHGVLPASQ
jgi:predicted Ser/Thr protein kinase